MPHQKPFLPAPPTPAELERKLAELEIFAASTWSNLAMVDKVFEFRAMFRAYLDAQRLASAGSPPAPIDPTERWG